MMFALSLGYILLSNVPFQNGKTVPLFLFIILLMFYRFAVTLIQPSFVITSVKESYHSLYNSEMTMHSVG
jgi:hypothetical protein